MNKIIDEFLKRANTLLSEPGILEKRPAWPSVKAGAISLAAFTDVALTQLPPQVALIFILAASTTGAKRDTILKTFFHRMLLQIPDDDLIKLLSKFSQAELKDNLVPFIYESGNRGATACFIAARLRVSLAAEAFQYFLSARPWNQTDLMNLSFLVRPEDSMALCSFLDTAMATADNKVTRENMSEFRQIVFNHLATEPMIPELAAVTEKEAPKVAELAKKSSQPVDLPADSGQAGTDRADQAAASYEKNDAPARRVPEPRSTEAPRPGLPLQKNEKTQIHSHFPENLLQYALPVGLILLCLTAGMLYTTWYFNYSDESGVASSSKNTSGKAPTQWVDSVTQRPVTAKYLAADKDYRMGELFLTSDRYSEALKLFEDALSIDPDHFQALVRAGFCRMQLGDNKKAADIFRRELDRQPNSEMVNLYLARISLANKDLKAAEKHFKAEFALNGSLMAGMELANFHARNGNNNEAMELIALLQEKHPGKNLVLASDAISGGNSGTGGQK